MAAGVCAGLLLIGAGGNAFAQARNPGAAPAAEAEHPSKASLDARWAEMKAKDPECKSVECLNLEDRMMVEEIKRPKTPEEIRAREAKTLEDARSELATWRLKRVQLEARQAQRRSVPRESWPEVINNSKLQYLRQDLFSEEQEIASARAMLSGIKGLVASGQIPVPLGVNADDDADAAMAPSIKVYEKERDIALLKVKYEMDLIEAKMSLELLRAIEQELILAARVKELTQKKGPQG
jgi:hypothetical protein